MLCTLRQTKLAASTIYTSSRCQGNVRLSQIDRYRSSSSCLWLLARDFGKGLKSMGRCFNNIVFFVEKYVYFIPVVSRVEILFLAEVTYCLRFLLLDIGLIALPCSLRMMCMNFNMIQSNEFLRTYLDILIALSGSVCFGSNVVNPFDFDSKRPEMVSTK